MTLWIKLKVLIKSQSTNQNSCLFSLLFPDWTCKDHLSMHLAKMRNQDGHLLRHGTTCEEPASYVSIQILIHTMGDVPLFLSNKLHDQKSCKNDRIWILTISDLISHNFFSIFEFQVIDCELSSRSPRNMNSALSVFWKI